MCNMCLIIGSGKLQFCNEFIEFCKVIIKLAFTVNKAIKMPSAKILQFSLNMPLNNSLS